MNAQIHIAKIYSNSMTTKFGPKMKYTIEDATGKKLDVWEESWDSSWREGMDIELEKSLIKSREFQGKTYYTYQKPYTVQNTAPKPQNEPISDYKQVLVELSKINTTLAYIKGKLDAQDIQNHIDTKFP